MDRIRKNYKAGSREFLLVCCLAIGATRAFAAGVEIDGATNTSLDTAPNGVPIVNIANPNARGLSHNSYRQFNVDQTGLILNNARQNVVNTQLGGQIFGNSHLNAPAKVILNEVTSTNSSVLNGFTEVAGQRADVVIANPNGISVNGAGFINSSRVTLSTGVPIIDAGGNLGGFDVRAGEITINGSGLNTRFQDSTSIYTHYLNLNASLHAKNLDILLGKNEIDYPGRKIVSSGSGSIKRVLLDSSALGGMYANKIVLVGTGQGLGMNLPPEVMASAGDIKISSDGRLVLQKLDAERNIALQTSDDIESKETVFAAQNVDIETTGELTVESGMIAANEHLSIEAARVDNRATLLAGLNVDGTMNSWGELDIQARDLLNSGEIIGTSEISATADHIENLGLFNAARRLHLSADSLTNRASLFSGGDTWLHLQNSLHNSANGAIFTFNNLVLAADDLGGKTAQITNDLGLIQSLQGNIDISALRFDNVGYADLQYDIIIYDLGNGVEKSDPAQAMNINLAYSTGYTKHHSKARRRWVNKVLGRLAKQAPLLYQANESQIRSNRSARFLAIETQLIDYSITTPALLDSGNDLNLQVDEFNNRDSIVSASGDINFNVANNYSNRATSSSELVTDYQYYTRANHNSNWKSDDKYSSLYSSGYVPLKRTKTISTNTVTQAGGNISGQIGGQLVNNGVLAGKHLSTSGVNPSDYARSSIVVPTNDFGLFVKAKSAESQYLIETNPKFTDFKNFISSSYLTDRLGYSSDTTLKRLGDAYYELKLVRDSVFQLSGRRYLDSSIQNDNQQFKYLMDNALVAQRELELAPGISLDEKQINRLTRDIVWLEQQLVAGEMVLVPTVYLANGPRPKLHGGRIIAGGDTSLKLEALANNGLVESGGDLGIVASDWIENRGVLASGGTLALVANSDITNISGRIDGSNVEVTSLEGNIVNRRNTEDYSYTERQLFGDELSLNTNFIDAAGVIRADNALNLDASGYILVEGSEISADQVSLKASDVQIKTTQKSEDFFSGDKRNHLREASTTHFASSINGEDIVVFSTGSTGISGSSLDATGTLRIQAGSIDIDAVTESEYYTSLETSDKTFSETVSSKKLFRSRNKGSELSATTVVLVTEHGDIELTGSEIAAGSRLVMRSANDIRISAGEDESLEESHRKKTSFLSGGSLYTRTEDLDGKMSRKAVSSQISAGSAEFDAAGEIELTGVEMTIADDFTASAQDITVRNANNEETRYSSHTEVKVGYTKLASGFSSFDDLVQVEDGKLRFELTEASYDRSELDTTEITAVASSIHANNVNFSAGDESSGDILIEGSDLLAKESIQLNASGDVTLLDAAHTYTSDSLTQSGSAELSLAVRNEYEQVSRSIKDLKQAESDLRHAQDDYDHYQNVLEEQESNFKQLRKNLAAGAGFIEQADIDDFKRYLDRLKDDEDFYKANIALANVTVVSRTIALIKQTGRAASSSATYGFNVALELDIDALEQHVEEYYRYSMASNLVGDRISIVAGDTALVRGSNLQAENSIKITASDIEILAGADLFKSDERQQKMDFSYNWNMLGDSSSMDYDLLGGDIGGEESRRKVDTTQNINSRLSANNIFLNTEYDTTIAGAEIHAKENLAVNTGSLYLTSVQDVSYTEDDSRKLSYSREGGDIEKSWGDGESVRTLISSMIGRQVDINVLQHSDIKGAVIAAVDETGSDNGNLNFNTNTLNAGSLNNTVENTRRSNGIGFGEVASLDYLDDAAFEKTKSLATIGNGNLQIGNAEDSDTRFLNTDIEQTEASIYDIDSHRGLSGELDTRLLTEAGRDVIAEDWLKTKMIANSIELIATTERIGVEDFFSETEKYHKTYETVKHEIARDPELARSLQNPNLTAGQKQAMLNQLVGAVMVRLGYEQHGNNIIATDASGRDGWEVNGFYSTATHQAYINDQNIDSTSGLIATAGHEATRAMDDQKNVDFEKDRVDRTLYAENYGENLALYTDHALDIGGYEDGLAKTNSHVGNDGRQVENNNQAFVELDKSKGDNYLSHEDKLRYNLLTDAWFDCDDEGGCTARQKEALVPEIARLLKQDKATDARLREACQFASSAACRAEVNQLKIAFDSYRNLSGAAEVFKDGSLSEYVEVASLYGEYRSQGMSDNAKRALVSMPIDTVTGAIDLGAVIAKASVGDEQARLQLSLISEGIQTFVADPMGTIESGIKAQLDEADRLEATGNLNKAEEIRSKVILEGTFAVVGTASGAFSLARIGLGAMDVPASTTAGSSNAVVYKKLVGVGADAVQEGLPENYARVVAPDGNIVILGPRQGVYEATDYVDNAGNPLYMNSGKLFSMDGSKEYVRLKNAQFKGNESHQIDRYLDRDSNAGSLNDSIEGLQATDGSVENWFAEDIAKKSTYRLGDKQRVVLGRWIEGGGYIEEAKTNGGIWFETDPELYTKLESKLSKKQLNTKLWAVNRQFLEIQMKQGVAQIELHGETIKEVLTNRPNSYTAMEIKYLENNAHKFGYTRKGNSWIKVK